MKTSYAILAFMVAVCITAASMLNPAAPPMQQAETGETVTAGNSAGVQSAAAANAQSAAQPASEEPGEPRSGSSGEEPEPGIGILKYTWDENGYKLIPKYDKTKTPAENGSIELYPSVGQAKMTATRELNGKDVSVSVYDDSLKNVVDRVVTVQNTGNVPVYVRVWFAFEMGSYKGDIFGDDDNDGGLIYRNLNKNDWVYSNMADITIAGKRYAVFYADYKNQLAVDAETEPSLIQFYVDKDAKNEDLAALDDDGNDGYEILIKARCIVPENGGTELNDPVYILQGYFNNEITQINHPWH